MALSASVQERLKTKYGPWALVTGSSSGIGLAMAEALARAQLNLILMARNETRLNEVADKLSQQYPIHCMVIAADLSTDEGVVQVKGMTRDKEIGLLIAAAGFGTSGEFLNADLAAELNMNQVNMNALLSLSHHFAQQFAVNKRGGLILLSSLVGFQGTPYAANYAATKAYVQSLGEALYLELKPHGVDVLAAAPGPVSSGFSTRANMQMGKTLSPETVAIESLSKLGRRGTVLPGFLTKFLVYSLRMLPRWGKVRVMRLVMGGMTKHQRI